MKSHVSDQWITLEEAKARVFLRLGIPETEALLLDAVSEGEIREKPASPTPLVPTLPDAIWGDLNVFAGGFTAVDLEYDERLGEILRPSLRVSEADLEAWLARMALARVAPSDPAKPSGRPKKRDRAVAAYLAIYPNHHQVTGDSWKVVLRKVTEMTGESVSEETLKRGLAEKS